MLVYRVFRHLPAATPGDNGHPFFVWNQTNRSRWDNGDLYTAWYVAKSPVGAIAETLGNYAFWDDSTFTPTNPAGSRLALAEFDLPNNSALFNLDDPNQLAYINMRPSEVVIRNRPQTQARARKIFQERHPTSTTRAWDGVSWWSFHDPTETVLAIFTPVGETPPLDLLNVTDLYPDSTYVKLAARQLNRQIR